MKKNTIFFRKEIKDGMEPTKTRGWIAAVMIGGFLILLGYAIVLFQIERIPDVKGLVDLITAIGAILGGLIGAIITFYFKS
jgi:hypothetical protein